MKDKYQFFVVRLNEEAIEVTPLESIYTKVQIHLGAKYLTEEDVYKLYGCMDRAFQLRAAANMLEKGCLSEEQEAKDLEMELSQYSMKIEERELEF